MSYYIYIYISRSLSPSALFPCSSLSLPSALFPCSSLSLPSALFHRATTATQSAEQQQHHPSAATEHRQPAKEKMKFGPKMLPRWSRVFSHIYKVNNLQRRREIRGDFFGSSFRNYVKVAAIVDPSETNSTETHSTINPEVNLKKMFWSKSCSLALAIDSPHRVEDPSYEGIRRFILRLMLFYSKQSQFIRWSHVIYRRVTYQVDRPAIYDVFSLEKTFKTTFSLLVLHMWLCLRRLKEEGKEGVELGQYLYELYYHDLELRVSKAGVNLLLIKWMKELEKIFYGNIVAYDAAIGKQNEFQNVIWKNVFSDDGSLQPSDTALLPVQAMTRYIRREASCLSLTDKETLLSGNFMFTSLENSCADTSRK